MSKYTPAQAEAIKRYMDKLGEIRVRVLKADKARYQEIAKAKGYDSLNKFIIEAIEEKILREQK